MSPHVPVAVPLYVRIAASFVIIEPLASLTSTLLTVHGLSVVHIFMPSALPNVALPMLSMKAKSLLRISSNTFASFDFQASQPFFSIAASPAVKDASADVAPPAAELLFDAALPFEDAVVVVAAGATFLSADGFVSAEAPGDVSIPFFSSIALAVEAFLSPSAPALGSTTATSL